MSPQVLAHSRYRWLRQALVHAGQNLWRNRFLSIATVAVIALMVFVFNVILALNFAARSALTTVGEKLDISVEVLDTAEPYTIQTFIASLRKHPGIKEVVFVSKEEGLKRLGGKYPNILSFLSAHQLKNPLPHVVRIVPESVSEHAAVLKYLENPEFATVADQQKLKSSEEQKNRSEKILNITSFIRGASVWLILIFMAVALILLFNSINITIFSHQKEIAIMKLVGAKYHLIRTIFIAEGLIFALSSLFISFFVSRLVLTYLARNLVELIHDESVLVGLNAIFLHFDDDLWWTFGWQVMATAAAGALASGLAIELYLRRDRTRF